MLRLRISRLEGVAIAVLAVVITGVLVVKRFVRNDSADVLPQPTDKQFEEYRKFTVARRERDDNHHGFSTPAVHAARLFRFNPNTADSATFVMLGLRPRQAMAIIHYRNAGGRFRKKEDFKRILTEPKNALVKQYEALLATEGVTLKFADEAIDRMSFIAEDVNSHSENIGARRLHTIMETVLEELSFDADRHAGETITIDSKYVDEKLNGVIQNQNLEPYIL